MHKKLVLLAMVLIFAVPGAVADQNQLSPADQISDQAQLSRTVGFSDSPSEITLIDQDNSGLTLNVNIGEIEFHQIRTKEGVFILPRVDGFTQSFEIGEPNLPMVNKLLSIPQGCKLKTTIIDFEIEEISLNNYGLNQPLMPVQPPLSKSDNPGSVPFEFNHAVYETAGYYTLPLTRTDVLGTMRAVRIGEVTIAPIEYNPTANTMKVYKNITVRVDFVDADWAATETMHNRLYSPYFQPTMEKMINYDMALFSAKADLVKYPVKYVIVADRMFEAQLQPFIEWKIKKGFDVITAYTDVIGSSSSAIKSYLQNLYNNGTAEDPAPSFVLFVGDAQQIAPYAGTAGSHITDLYFCEFTGDDFPEIYYGRFSAQNTSELQPQIDKSLEYERYLMPDPSYLGEVTMVSGVDSYYAATHGNGQINYGTTLYFNAAHGIAPNVWLYPDSDASGARTAIIQTIDDGVGFYNYTAHCSHTGPQDPSFTTSDIDNLTNYNKYLLGIGNCCLSNTFGTDYSTPCFGEKWLQADGKGGIGWIGGSNSTYWNEDYWWGVGNGPIESGGPTYNETGLGAYDGVFHDHGEAVSDHYITNSAIIFRGNMAVTEAGSSRDTYYWEIYHLMGDPSIITYMGMPSTNGVSHPSSLNISATSVTVSADAGSYVGVSFGGVLHGAGYVDATGSVDITLDPFGPTGTADIVVTCQNHIPYESTINITGGTTPPTAEFSGTPTTGIEPLTIDFTDLSTDNPTSWSWDFGDGGSSTEQNPSHTYDAGTYTVTLTSSNAYGSDDEVKVGYITVDPCVPPVAGFSGSPTVGDAPLTIDFTDQSTNATSWSWNFGDGGTSTAQNPSHTYTAEGTYTVTLAATNACGSDNEVKTDYITVMSSPDIKSYALSDIPVIGTVSGDYLDTRTSDNIYETITEIEYTGHPRKRYSYLEHKWNFDVTSGSTITFYLEAYRTANSDGDNFVFEYSTDDVTYLSLVTVASATEQVYSTTIPNSTSGTVYVRVTDSNRAWDMNSLDPVYIDEMYFKTTGAGPVAPTADFSATPTSGNPPLTVNFTDLSTGDPTTWDWTFGDGGTSTAQNPSHTYNSVGLYTVSLTVSNANGSDSETKTDYISVFESGGTVHVENMVIGRRKAGPNYFGTCTVTIYDNLNNPVSDATVYVTATGPTGGSYNGVTGGDGTVYFETSGMKRPSGEWCFEVTDVTHATMTYDAGSNVVTKACESGPVFKGLTDVVIPTEFGLHQNIPNPFNPVTEIGFSLPTATHVNLTVYNILGQQVSTLADRYFEAGNHTVVWDASSSPSGIYLYRIDAGQFNASRKMILLK